jgi:hypothetical protein
MHGPSPGGPLPVALALAALEMPLARFAAAGGPQPWQAHPTAAPEVEVILSYTGECTAVDAGRAPLRRVR